MGVGVIDSLRFILRRREGQLCSKGIRINLVVKDDMGDPSLALQNFRDLDREGVFCVVGPCDSGCVHLILSEERAAEVPIVTPLATATVLTELGASKFFRVTTPDRIRADMLVRLLRRMHPQRCVFVCAVGDSLFSYSRQLRFDVAKSLDEHGLRWQLEELNSLGSLSHAPEDDQPVVICGPSEDVVKVVASLRRLGIQSPVFAFGSNSNLLIPELENAIVMADLDREDANAQVREEIEHFVEARSSKGDPSLAAMNCMTLLVNLLLQGEGFPDLDLSGIRESVASALRHGPLRGLFGPIAFTDAGEMIGWEHVSVLRVSLVRGEPVFKSLTGGDAGVAGDGKRYRYASPIKIFVSHSSEDSEVRSRSSCKGNSLYQR
jgi:ABC-type branched-subunit amino acid transport system substrate-binding protein